jgi:hypothetical protein
VALFDDIPMAKASEAAPAQAGLFDDLPMAKAQESVGLFDDIEVTNKPQYSTPETSEQDSTLILQGNFRAALLRG